MGNYFFTEKAIEDISAIWDYSYDTWSEKQADKYYQQLIVTCKEIADNPKLGKEYLEIENGVFGFHINRHIIFYRQSKLNEIEVLRILHEKMDLKKRIKE